MTSCVYEDGRWNIETASGFRDVADFVIAATGVLHHPRVPDIDGLADFGGPLFHSARWDHSARLDGARGGVVGTGSTAVQIVSAIVDQVSKLSLFQRTAQWVLQQPNPEYSEEERSAFREHPDMIEENRRHLAEIFEMFSIAVVDAESEATKFIEQACAANLENVRDPELRERLRPDYRAACKRLVIAPDFYGAIQHPNAELVTEPILRIERDGIRTADGRLHELDVLILATGFKTDAFMRPMRIVGRNGLTLEEAWSPRPVAYLSVSIPEFPNLLHAQRAERTGRELFPYRSGRAPTVVHPSACRTPEDRRESRDRCDAEGLGRVRGGPGRCLGTDRLGHRVQELVPGRSRTSSRLAVAFRSIPRADGVARSQRIRARVKLERALSP